MTSQDLLEDIETLEICIKFEDGRPALVTFNLWIWQTAANVLGMNIHNFFLRWPFKFVDAALARKTDAVASIVEECVHLTDKVVFSLLTGVRD